jgi:hypothetical protein
MADPAEGWSGSSTGGAMGSLIYGVHICTCGRDRSEMNDEAGKNRVRQHKGVMWMRNTRKK